MTAQSQSSPSQQQDIPDAPSAVQPPQPKPEVPPTPPPDEEKKETKKQPNLNPFVDPAKPPAQTGEPETIMERHSATSPTPAYSPTKPPRNQVDPTQDLYKIRTSVNFVLIPVTVKDSGGHRVDGLEPNDFAVYENGKKQTLKFFTSDPFPLSVAIVLDIGMPDVAVQQINKTYTALIGAFSPYDEVGVYSYSSTVTQLSDFTSHSQRLTAVLNEVKVAHGTSAGPPVMTGPLGTQTGPMVNGMPVGGPPISPLGNPPKEYHVLNDALLRAAIDLGNRDKTRRKVIFIISDGRERGSRSSYRDVLRILESRNIQVKAILVDSSALPGFHQMEKIHHIPFQGYADILPKYTSATGGGQPLSELSQNSIEEAYDEVMSEARNQYTLGYNAQAVVSASAYRDLVVTVDHKGLKVYAKDGYYPLPNQASGIAAGAPPVSSPPATPDATTNSSPKQNQ